MRKIFFGDLIKFVNPQRTCSYGRVVAAELADRLTHRRFTLKKPRTAQ